MTKRTNPVAWTLVGVLAVMVIAGIGWLGARLRPYWVARYRGVGANLRGADLAQASLRDAVLSGADLRGTNLSSLSLKPCRKVCGALGADLQNADLRGAKLGGATLIHADLHLADLRGADLRSSSVAAARLTGAIYDAQTRWPASFDPRRYGAIKVE